VGDTVELVGERNEETAQLFGDGQNPAGPQDSETVETAMVVVDAAPLESTGLGAAQDMNTEARATAAPFADAAVVASR
jgi:hypothetical protein